MAEEEIKPYAVLILTNLKVRQFLYKDDLKDAIIALTKQKIGFIPLKYQPETKEYIAQEFYV